MKKLKYSILFFILVIIIIILVLLIIGNNKEDNEDLGIVVPEDDKEEMLVEEGDPPQDININNYNKIQNVSSIDDYFTIKALTDNYINLVGIKDTARIKKILSPRYIKTYNITNDNVIKSSNIPTLTEEGQYYKTVILSMTESKVNSNIFVYFVSGKGRVVGTEKKFSFNLMLEVDTSKNLYNIYPYSYIRDKGYNNLNIGNTINYEIEDIEDRENNSFSYITKTDQDMANEYFNNYVELLFYYKDDAYNKLNSEYSKKRFGNKEGFNTYLSDNKILLATMNIDKYKVVTNDSYTDYVCADKYSNIYIFRQNKGITNYTVFLDNYTIMSEDELKDYNNLDKFAKAKYNLNKFIKMINTKDYNAIYNTLNNSFKNSNFKTVNDLKKYTQDNLYDINSIEIKEYDKDTYEYYIFTCKVTNKRNTEETKNMTIIINQGEGTDFEMSFSME